MRKIYPPLLEARRQRRYERWKYQHMTHRGRTGHNWQDNKEKPGFCKVCEEVRLCERKFTGCKLTPMEGE